ncbi:hypothetical protein LCGC14_2460970 [marine sediment metagenome]|uniref:Uncharacterized protein n=1 Tax=marine sediment metagenome TaxID=412755 RepID=A0A0F9C0Z6_9ZZZZ
MTVQPRAERFLGDQVINKVTYPEADVSLGAEDQVVRASTVSGGGGAFTITLPSVVAAKGRFYSIFMVARNSAENITVQDKGDDTGLSDITLNAADERVLLYSDGFHWYTVASENI